MALSLKDIAKPSKKKPSATKPESIPDRKVMLPWMYEDSTPPSSQKAEIIETPKVEPQREISQSSKLQNDNYVYKLSLINEALKQGILTIEEYYQKRKNLERGLGLL